jgi:cell division protein FtsI (penicillin-binding protein 3)
MKSFVIAAGLKQKILQPNTKYFCENGLMKIGDRTIREAETSHSFGNLTVTEILAKSSNIGTTKIAFQLGAENLRKVYQDFGFGERTFIDFPGETKGILHSLPWNPHLLSNISFGHGITASPIQIANAYAALVNGGFLNKPYLVESVKDPETSESKHFTPELLRKVLADQESKQMRMMLSSVTAEGGTGQAARVKGFIVGGKTGTAQKVSPNKRGYMPGAYISSFVGFIPANDPRFVIYVAIDHPKKAFYGSTVAAPLFARLAGFAARREGLPPSELLLSSSSRSRKISSSIDKVDSSTSSSVMPSILNLPLREALHILQPLNKPLEVKGSGRVSDLWPQPGQNLDGIEKIIIQLE